MYLIIYQEFFFLLNPYFTPDFTGEPLINEEISYIKDWYYPSPELQVGIELVTFRL
jgi:hypothetical protein